MKNELYISSNKIADDSNLFGGVDYNCCVNRENDIYLGTTAMATIEFVWERPSGLSGFNVGTEIIYKKKGIGDNAFSQIGIFIVKSIEVEGNKERIYAEDRMCYLDEEVVTSLPSVSYPTVLMTITHLLDNYTYNTNNLYGSVDVVKNNLLALLENTTKRDLLQDLCEVGGVYCYVDSVGTFRFDYFGRNASVATISENNYKKATLSQTTVPLIIDAAGLYYGALISATTSFSENDNNYIVKDNKVFNSMFSSSTAKQSLTNLRTRMRRMPLYYFGTVEISNTSAKVGDTITVVKDNVSHPFIITEKRITSKGVTLVSDGQTRRTSVNLEAYARTSTLPQELTSSVTNQAGTRLVEFGSEGITCYDNGWRIKNSYDDIVMEADQNGDLKCYGSTEVEINGNYYDIDSESKLNSGGIEFEVTPPSQSTKSAVIGMSGDMGGTLIITTPDAEILINSDDYVQIQSTTAVYITAPSVIINGYELSFDGSGYVKYT